MFLVVIENAALLKVSADSMMVCNGAESQTHFRLHTRAVKEPKQGASCGAHLRAGGVRRAPGPLAPRSELLSAMLSHSLQQQVVDGREMVVAAALQRLMRTERINDLAHDPVAAAFRPYQCFFTAPCGSLFSSRENLSLSKCQTSVQAPQLSFGGRSPVCS